jgi:hypothetical protein
LIVTVAVFSRKKPAPVPAGSGVHGIVVPGPKAVAGAVPTGQIGLATPEQLMLEPLTSAGWLPHVAEVIPAALPVVESVTVAVTS